MEIPEGISERNFNKAVRCHQQVLTSGYSPVQFRKYYKHPVQYSGSPNTAPKSAQPECFGSRLVLNYGSLVNDLGSLEVLLTFGCWSLDMESWPGL